MIEEKIGGKFDSNFNEELGKVKNVSELTRFIK